MGRTTSGDSRCVGIVGGLGVGATIHYYQELAAAHTARGCPPSCLISHADLDDANTDFPSIDCARVHIDAIVRQALH